MLERLEKIRNLKYNLKRRLLPNSCYTVSDIVGMVGGSLSGSIPLDSKISFIGFFNDFNNIIGRDCIYVCFDQADIALAKQAVSHGAIAILSDFKVEELPCILVEDVYEAFLTLAETIYTGYNIPATVVTGSIGKTTTKEMIACVYREYYKTFCAPINGNTMRYTAFEIQHIPANTQQFVQEVDESFPHNASYCSRILHPRIAAITNIDKSHIGALGGEQQIARAITSVTDYMTPDDYVIINADDKITSEQAFSQKTVTISINDNHADCHAFDISLMADETRFSLCYGQETIPVTIHCPGIHNVYNALMAFCAGKLSGIPTEKILRGLKKYRPMTVRQKTYHVSGKTLYVDCFNASARSIAGALKVVDGMTPGKNGRRIAILGDVGEIEGHETETYSEIAASISASSVDILVTYGSSSKLIWDFLETDQSGIHICDESALLEYLKKELKRGDVALFKASGFMKLDHIVQKLYPLTFYSQKLPYYREYASFILQTL